METKNKPVKKKSTAVSKAATLVRNNENALQYPRGRFDAVALQGVARPKKHR